MTCRNGHLKVVQHLARDGLAKVGAEEIDERTVLQYACQKGRLTVSQCLVKDGKADVEAKEDGGYAARREGHSEVAQSLARHRDANDGATTIEGTSASDAARLEGKNDALPPLTNYSRGNRSTSITSGSLATDSLFESTTLREAAKYGALDQVKKCVQQNVDVNAKDNVLGCTSLHWVSWNGHFDVVPYITVDVDVKEKDRHTSLHAASHCERLKVVQYLARDGTTDVERSTRSLKSICEIALQCMSSSLDDRPTTQDVNQKLGEISKRDFRGTVTRKDDPPQAKDKVSVGSFEELSTASCVLCHESVAVSITCSEKHTTCIPCAEQRVQDHIGRGGDGVFCGFVGCNERYKDDSLYGKVSSFTYNEYVKDRERQKGVDNILKVIGENHVKVMTSLKENKSLTQRSLKGLAYLATESVKKCPTLVWMVPAERIDGCSARDWVKWAKNAITHRRYHVYFVCQHSFAAVDVEPRIEIDVPRSWMVQAAPVLRLSIFAIKSALSAFGPLPFPVPNFLRTEQIAMMEQLVNSFLDDATTNLLDAFEAACTSGFDLPQTGSSQLMTLTGQAYEGIVEKATKWKRMHWKQSMVPVMNHHGSLI